MLILYPLVSHTVIKIGLEAVEAEGKPNVGNNELEKKSEMLD